MAFVYVVIRLCHWGGWAGLIDKNQTNRCVAVPIVQDIQCNIHIAICISHQIWFGWALLHNYNSLLASKASHDRANRTAYPLSLVPQDWMKVHETVSSKWSQLVHLCGVCAWGHVRWCVCVHVCACACRCHSSSREDIICEGTKSAGKLHTAAEHKQASCLTHTKSVHNTTDQWHQIHYYLSELVLKYYIQSIRV